MAEVKCLWSGDFFYCRLVNMVVPFRKKPRGWPFRVHLDGTAHISQSLESKLSLVYNQVPRFCVLLHWTLFRHCQGLPQRRGNGTFPLKKLEVITRFPEVKVKLSHRPSREVRWSPASRMAVLVVIRHRGFNLIHMSWFIISISEPGSMRASSVWHW